MRPGNLHKVQGKEDRWTRLTVEVDPNLASPAISLNDGSIRLFTI